MADKKPEICIENLTEGIIGLGVTAETTIRLMPGLNPHVDKAEWERIKSLPVIKSKLQRRHIRVRADVKPDALPADAEKAVDVVRDTYDPIVLSEWLGAEKRSAVRAAIEEQRDSIKPDLPRRAEGRPVPGAE